MNNTEISKCLREVSALVADGHPYEKCVQSRFTEEFARYSGANRSWMRSKDPCWSSGDLEFRVAKGFVEGKPVFAGDICFGRTGGKQHIMYETGKWDSWVAFEDLDATWTPPAPKVEIPEGFIEWHGGECPVDGDLAITVLLRDGEYREKNLARHFRWDHSQRELRYSADVIAYKVHKPTTFTLNGEVLPLPYRIGYNYNAGEFYIGIGNHYWSYKAKSDADKVRAAFAKLGEGL